MLVNDEMRARGCPGRRRAKFGLGEITYYYAGPTKNELYALVSFQAPEQGVGYTDFHVDSAPISIPATSKVKPYAP
jgi:hypothetical protein